MLDRLEADRPLSLYRIIYTITLTISASGMGSLMSCQQLSPSPPSTMKISSIQTNKKLNYHVYVQGQVTKKAPLLGTTAYQIKDSSGMIWVLTNNQGPQVGEKLLINGQVQYQSIPISNLEFGEVYVLEKNRELADEKSQPSLKK